MPEYTHRRQFVANTHLTYGPTSRTAAPGDVLDGLPSESISWLLEQGHIAEVQSSVPGLPLTSFPVVPSPRRSAE